MAEKILKLVGPTHFIGGIAIALVPLFTGLHVHIVAAFFGEHAVPTSQTIFLLSVFGPTIASWGVLFHIVVGKFFERPDLRLWRGMLLSVLIWAPLDTAISLAYGIYLAVAINAAVVVILLALLFRVRKLAAGS